MKFDASRWRSMKFVEVRALAIAKFVARHGTGLVHVAFATRNIDAILQDLDAEGWRMIDTRSRHGGRGTQIGFVHPSNFGGGLLTHFVQNPET